VDVEPNPDINYSSLGERVKSRQREAAQKANMATLAAFSQVSTNSASSQQTLATLATFDSTLNSNSQLTNNSEVPIQNHKPVKVEANSVEEDKDWQLPTPKKSRSESSSRRQSSAPA